MTALDAGLGVIPGAAPALRAWRDAAWREVDPSLLQLCAALVARSIGGDGVERDFTDPTPSAETARKVAALGSWWGDPAFDEREKACLRLTEQWLVDVGGVTDQHVDDLLVHLSPPEVLGLLMGLVAVEQSSRVAVALARLQRTEAP